MFLSVGLFIRSGGVLGGGCDSGSSFVFEESGLHSGTHCMVYLYPSGHDMSIRPAGIEIWKYKYIIQTNYLLFQWHYELSMKRLQ